MMEMEKVSSTVTNNCNKLEAEDHDEDEDVALPGFRFHPTDEELVGFYLRRKVEKRPIGLELIKQIDIYKYDPWDLPSIYRREFLFRVNPNCTREVLVDMLNERSNTTEIEYKFCALIAANFLTPSEASNNNGDKEWYFYCKRGRKYKNSVRPNRVTAGSGFWKATGIDRPIYSSNITNGDQVRKCIGLKKSLVYYRGSAGKGTKTDWQMHEFRLPTENDKSTKHLDANSIAQEAETWTLCRILKRNASYRKSIPDWKEVATKQRNAVVNMDAGSKIRNNNVDSSNNSQIYISFSSTPVIKQNTYKDKTVLPLIDHADIKTNNQQFVGQQSDENIQSTADAASNSSLLNSPLEFNNWLEHGNWDELKSIMELSNFDP